MVTGAVLLFVSTSTVCVVYVGDTAATAAEYTRPVSSLEELAIVKPRPVDEPEEFLALEAPRVRQPVRKPQKRALGYRGVRYPVGFV